MKRTPKQRVLTGSRPSGTPHLGNYFGAYRPAINLQKNAELFFFLADYHALNEGFPPKELHDQSLILAAAMIACGFQLDESKGCFYTQSGIPEVCDLAWILGCQAPYGLLQRAHSFKDATAKGNEVNAGVFNYPVLMAADILLYDATHVPVGQDQKQHLEITRDLAQRFNHHYAETFILPEPVIAEAVAVIPGTDGEKMSKSKGNIIPIFGSDKEWKTAVMGIKTDSKGLDDPKDPDTCIIYKLFKLLADQGACAEMARKYRAGGYGYGHAKIELLEIIKKTFSPMRDRYNELISHPDDIKDILQTGTARARKIAIEKMAKVRQIVGVIC